MKVRKKRKPQKKVAQQLELLKSGELAKQRLDEFLDHKMVKNSNRKNCRKTPFMKAVDDAERRSKVGDWSSVNGRTFVGLYGLCYRIVYDRLPIDIDVNGEFIQASKLANMMLHIHFNDDVHEFVEFIKWTWEREKVRVFRAMRDGYDKSRITARYQFSRRCIEDYRVFLSNRNRYG